MSKEVHHFNVEIAQMFGVDVAIFLDHLFFWIKKNQANRHNFFDGRYWTRNKMEAFLEIFPYWTYKQMRRIIATVEAHDLVIIGNHNTNKYDQTGWYAMSDKAHEIYNLPICPNGQIEMTKRADQFAQTGSTIPVTNTVTNTDIKNSCPSGDGLNIEQQSFDCFWESYPRKEAKKAARKAWKKIKQEKYEQIISDVNQRKHHNWKDKAANYIPLPASYLNGERWNDQLFITSGEQQNGNQAKADRRNQFQARLEQRTIDLAQRYAEEGLSYMD